MGLVLRCDGGSANQLTKPRIGGDGVTFGSPSYTFGAAKYGNGVENTVANAGEAFTGTKVDIGLFSAGFWVQYDNVVPTSQGHCMFYGNEASFVAPSICFGSSTSLNVFFIAFHTTASKYVYLRPPYADLAYTATGQLQYIEIVVDSTGLTAGTGINDGNVGTMIKVYTTDSSNVFASRTITNGSNTYSGGITFGDFQTAGNTNKDLTMASNSITGLYNTSFVDDLRFFNHARTIGEMNDRFFYGYGGQKRRVS